MYSIIDLHFQEMDQSIGAFLIESSDGPLLIETGPYSTFKDLEKGLNEKGYKPEDVKHVLLTHIHFDHAGAAWAFAEKGAKIYMHPFGSKHMQDPTRLIESATMIYGEKMDSLWGKIGKIDASQIVEVADGEQLSFGDINITALHTPGHAKHHIAWQLGKTIFTGDVAGVKIQGGPVVPPCPPPDIDLEDWSKSLKILIDKEPEKLVLTHYGEVDDPSSHLAELHEALRDWKEFVEDAWQSGITSEQIAPIFTKYVKDNFRIQGMQEYTINRYEAANPSWMSVAGLVRYLRQKIKEEVTT